MQKDFTGELFFGESPNYQESYRFYLDNYIDNVLGDPNIANKTELGINRGNSLVDKNTEYKKNNFGFRDVDWEGAPDSIVAGCSMTYGSGVPVNARWSNVLAGITKKNIRNISNPGLSIHQIVLEIFAHCKLFGNPKEILCLFPDPFRTIVPTRKDLVTVRGVGSPKSTVNMFYLNNNKIKEKKVYVKKPYDYEDFLPLEFPLYFSMMAIHTLEQYCKSSNIKLFWSSWDNHFKDFLIKLDEEMPFANFFDANTLQYPNFKELECHNENKDLFPNYFYNGQDIEEGTEFSHPGHHWHIHVAESFYEKITK